MSALDTAFRAVSVVQGGWSYLESIHTNSWAFSPLPITLNEIRSHFFRLADCKNERDFAFAIENMKRIWEMTWTNWVIDSMRKQL